MRTHHIKLGPGLNKMSPCGCYKYFYHKRNMISHKRKCQKSSYCMKMLTSVKRNESIQVSRTLRLLVIILTYEFYSISIRTCSSVVYSSDSEVVDELDGAQQTCTEKQS